MCLKMGEGGEGEGESRRKGEGGREGERTRSYWNKGGDLVAVLGGGEYDQMHCIKC